MVIFEISKFFCSMTKCKPKLSNFLKKWDCVKILILISRFKIFVQGGILVLKHFWSKKDWLSLKLSNTIARTVVWTMRDLGLSPCFILLWTVFTPNNYYRGMNLIFNISDFCNNHVAVEIGQKDLDPDVLPKSNTVFHSKMYIGAHFIF